ncbi:ATP-binding protein [Eubacteriales bacterium OttesenSCG-928-K08]|nr:ATP-binding protein [Eubacteriales bacterium OttesenSCG-928-K08]
MPEWSFKDTFSTPEQMRVVLRNMLNDVRANLEVDEELWYDMKIILHELCCNAINHGKVPVQTMSAICSKDKKLHILVSDAGEGHNQLQKGPSGNDAEHGRGLHIVSNLADELMFNSSANKVLVMIDYR